MINYVITVRDGYITGVHSGIGVSKESFAESRYAEDEVIDVPADSEYQTGHKLAEYTDGRLRPLLDRVLDGLADVPPGYELIDGELIAVDKPVEEQSDSSIKSRLERMDAQAETEQKAARVMFRALAMTDVITAVDALDNAVMFPAWADCIGQRAEAGSYWRHGDNLYRVNVGQGHTIQADWPPDQAVSLFSTAANPADEWPEWIQPLGVHNAYVKGAKVVHKGKRWTSTVDGNVWEPGVYGWEKQG